MQRLEKGQHRPLNVTQKAQHRVFAGLGWEPHTNAGLMEKIGAIVGTKKIYHDLDLGCLLFDAKKKPIGDISVLHGHMADPTGHIYHSGDNVDGASEGDDEQVSVELLSIDKAIDYIMFVATIKSGHTFGELHQPEIRIADGYSNHNFLQTPLTHIEGKVKSAFAFASIYRSGEGWNLHNISTYLDLPAIQKPNGALSSLLTKI
jgi:stress response protein SCP2